MQPARQDTGRNDPVAVQVKDTQPAIDWYGRHFQSEILYQDDSWASFRFASINLALVIPEQHPPHCSDMPGCGFFR